MQETVWTVLT